MATLENKKFNNKLLKTQHYILAGAPGFEPGNGGIKIQVVCIIYQRGFRKIAGIRIESNQYVSRYFGMADTRWPPGEQASPTLPRASLDIAVTKVAPDDLSGRPRYGV